MSDIVYAKTSVVLAHAGQRVHVRAGEPWTAADPLVKQYPEVFAQHLRAVRTTEDPRGFREYVPADEEQQVERGTRGPGEKRTTRRGRPPKNTTPENDGEGADGGE